MSSQNMVKTLVDIFNDADLIEIPEDWWSQLRVYREKRREVFDNYWRERGGYGTTYEEPVYTLTLKEVMVFFKTLVSLKYLKEAVSESIAANNYNDDGDLILLDGGGRLNGLLNWFPVSRGASHFCLAGAPNHGDDQRVIGYLYLAVLFYLSGKPIDDVVTEDIWPFIKKFNLPMGLPSTVRIDCPERRSRQSSGKTKPEVKTTIGKVKKKTTPGAKKKAAKSKKKVN